MLTKAMALLLPALLGPPDVLLLLVSSGRAPLPGAPAAPRAAAIADTAALCMPPGSAVCCRGIREGVLQVIWGTGLLLELKLVILKELRGADLDPDDAATGDDADPKAWDVIGVQTVGVLPMVCGDEGREGAADKVPRHLRFSCFRFFSDSRPSNTLTLPPRPPLPAPLTDPIIPLVLPYATVPLSTSAGTIVGVDTNLNSRRRYSRLVRLPSILKSCTDSSRLPPQMGPGPVATKRRSIHLLLLMVLLLPRPPLCPKPLLRVVLPAGAVVGLVGRH